METCYSGKYRRAYDIFRNAAYAGKNLIAQSSVNPFLEAAGWDLDSAEFANFLSVWSILRLDLIPGEADYPVYQGMLFQFPPYDADKALMPDYLLKCPSYALRNRE